MATGQSSGAAASGQSNSKSDKKEKIKKYIKNSTKSFWDPLDSVDWDQTGAPGPLAATRIRRDISSIFKEPLPGILTVPDDKNLCLVHCLLLGSFDTPYEGGFFHFLVRFGPSYPMHPPRVRLITTERGKVRFNPNLYSSGRVCLSILGTWAGPAWSPASNLGSLLLSIQSIMNEKPYFNEPGFTKEQYIGQSDQYNLYLTHETLRVAVCTQMESILHGTVHERIPLPKELHAFMKNTFLEFYDQYLETCDKHQDMDGRTVKDPYAEVQSPFSFSDIAKRLKEIKKALCKDTPKLESKTESIDSSPSSLSSNEDSQDASTSGTKPEPKNKSLLSELNEYAISDDGALNDTGDEWLFDESDDESNYEEEEEGSNE